MKKVAVMYFACTSFNFNSEGVLDVEQCPTARYTPGGPMVWQRGMAPLDTPGMVWYGMVW